uniref:Cytochrome c556 n=1 Tax=Candidatus Kentrum sp. FW TaxID=2126338 RepID=A0A450TTE8_9GAMM|nr:MAG: Cytochrome c556 [Candidatus Kentron sp. FW]VFJ71747.1 MAG: Cytochrome c556 [Candidatus Kentron sp. FW]
MRFFSFSIVTLSLLLSPMAMADDPMEKAVDARGAYFTLLGANLGPLAAMAKGKAPYDQATAVSHGANLEALAGYDASIHFPKGSSLDDLGDDTEAKAKIWSNWDDFAKELTAFQKAAKNAGKDVEGGKGQVGAVVQRMGKTCKSCHDQYRKK